MELTRLRQIHERLDALEAVAHLARAGRDPARREEAARELAEGLAAALALDRRCPAVYAFHGEHRERMGELLAAAEIYGAGADASDDPDLRMRQVACLRALGDDTQAAAVLAAWLVTPMGAADPRGHWQVAAGHLEAGDPVAAAELLREYLTRCPVRDAEDLAAKLPALLLWIETGDDFGDDFGDLRLARALARRYPGVDAELLAAAPGVLGGEAAAARALREALRAAPHHPWGHYFVATYEAGHDLDAARAALAIAIQEPALAWRARRDIRVRALLADVSAAEADELWLAEVAPEVRERRVYLSLRPDDDDGPERAWWSLPPATRRWSRFVPGDEVDAADGPVDDERWYLRIDLSDLREPVAARAVEDAVRRLAPWLDDGRVLVSDGARWIDELRISGGVVSVRRDPLFAGAQLTYLAARALRDPEDASLRLLTARLHREAARDAWTRQPEVAEGRLSVALALTPDDAEAWELRGHVARKQDAPDIACDAYREALQRDPTRGACHLALAEILRETDVAAAIEHLSAAAELPGAPVDIHHRLGFLLHGEGRLDEATAAYARSVSRRPQRASGSKLNLGNLHAARKDWPQALAWYDQAIAEEPTMALAWGGRGQALRNLGRRKEAGAALDRAIALDPSFHNFWLEQANLYFDDSERAVRLCDEALQRKPDCAYSWSTRGSALNNLGRHAEAHECYTRSIALDPKYGHPWYCRACSYALQGELEQALAAAERALQLDPSWRAAMRGEADLARLRGDPRFAALLR